MYQKNFPAIETGYKCMMNEGVVVNLKAYSIGFCTIRNEHI